MTKPVYTYTYTEYQALRAENERLKKELEKWRHVITVIRLRCEETDNLATKPMKAWLDEQIAAREET